MLNGYFGKNKTLEMIKDSIDSLQTLLDLGVTNEDVIRRLDLLILEYHYLHTLSDDNNFITKRSDFIHSLEY